VGRIISAAGFRPTMARSLAIPVSIDVILRHALA
jgi:hypothetical protein